MRRVPAEALALAASPQRVEDEAEEVTPAAQVTPFECIVTDAHARMRLVPAEALALAASPERVEVEAEEVTPAAQVTPFECIVTDSQTTTHACEAYPQKR